ncbi:polycystic kidney disease protein 1-like 3 [Schistocerca nitens]|uniref:polycystic kidney disease protein 1-like 3 n=1 Tax=Schistocerca nitens TaxID=7011 RepID=UPI002119A3B4|nr:polycystic kidney disease protein 1-like 3 [Schistocerca nitens]
MSTLPLTYVAAVRSTTTAEVQPDVATDPRASDSVLDTPMDTSSPEGIAVPTTEVPVASSISAVPSLDSHHEVAHSQADHTGRHVSSNMDPISVQNALPPAQDSSSTSSAADLQSVATSPQKHKKRRIAHKAAANAAPPLREKGAQIARSLPDISLDRPTEQPQHETPQVSDVSVPHPDGAGHVAANEGQTPREDLRDTPEHQSHNDQGSIGEVAAVHVIEPAIPPATNKSDVEPEDTTDQQQLTTTLSVTGDAQQPPQRDQHEEVAGKHRLHNKPRQQASGGNKQEKAVAKQQLTSGAQAAKRKSEQGSEQLPQRTRRHSATSAAGAATTQADDATYTDTAGGRAQQTDRPAETPWWKQEEDDPGPH